MKRIKFLSTEIYESEGRNQGPKYRKGSVHNFEDHFAERWLRRGVAVETKAQLDEDGDGDEDDAATRAAGDNGPQPLKGLNKEALLAAATGEGVTEAIDHLNNVVPVAAATKAQITAAIEAKRAAPAGDK